MFPWGLTTIDRMITRDLSLPVTNETRCIIIVDVQFLVNVFGPSAEGPWSERDQNRVSSSHALLDFAVSEKTIFGEIGGTLKSSPARRQRFQEDPRI
jgi:hypothetical protein